MSEEWVPNDQLEIPTECRDFGELLKTLRNNHGYSIPKMSKMLPNLTPADISQIELSKRGLPPENILRIWLTKLGLKGRKLESVILLARQFIPDQRFRLHRADDSNPDIVRLVTAYKNRTLTEYDRYLLRLIARKPNATG